MILGGFGAPLFLFLAGVSARAVGRIEVSQDRRFRCARGGRSQKRGWQIFGLAFLFRLQSYVLSGGYSAVSLLKVDILNVMGPAIALAAIAGTVAPTTTVGRAVTVRCDRRRDRDAHADRPHHATARLAARSARVVFPADSPGGPTSRCFPGRDSCSPAPRLASSGSPSRTRSRSDAAEFRLGWPRRCPGWRCWRYRGVVPAVHLRAVRVLDQLACVFLSPGRPHHAAAPARVISGSGALARQGRAAGALSRSWAGRRCSSTGSTSRWSMDSSAGRFSRALSLEMALVAYVLFSAFLLVLVLLEESAAGRRARSTQPLSN